MNKLSSNKALNQQGLMDMFDALQTAEKYRALTSGGLAIGTGSKKQVKIASTVTYLHNGIFKTKTTAEVAFTATTHDIAANASAAQEAKYLMCLIADGTPSLTMGAIATGAGNSVLPEIPEGKTPIGYVTVRVAAGATPFDATTDDLDAAHLTVSYTDLGWLSPRFDAVQ